MRVLQPGVPDSVHHKPLPRATQFPQPVANLGIDFADGHYIILRGADGCAMNRNLTV